MEDSDTTVLFRPVRQKEMAVIAQCGFLEFPPDASHGPVLYPLVHEEYATLTARGYGGYVTRFHVKAEYLDRFQAQTMGSSIHQEYWIPAEELPEFNANIVGLIEVIAGFHDEKRSAANE